MLRNLVLFSLLWTLTFAGEHYKELKGMYSYTEATTQCSSIGPEWRLAQIWELFGLRGKTEEFGLDKRYWSKTLIKENRDLKVHTSSDESYIKAHENELQAFAFYLQDGDITPTPLFLKANVICTDYIAKDQSTKPFTLKGELVHDSLNKIIWAPLNEHKLSQADASEYCSEMELDGKSWRLPTLDELYSIVNYSFVKPTVATNIFSTMRNKYYWSDDTFKDDSAYVVGFSIGTVATSKDNLKISFRCVSDME